MGRPGSFLRSLACTCDSFFGLFAYSLSRLLSFLSDSFHRLLGFIAYGLGSFLNFLACFFCPLLYLLARPFLPKRGERSSCDQSENQTCDLHGLLLSICVPNNFRIRRRSRACHFGLVKIRTGGPVLRLAAHSSVNRRKHPG